MHWESIFHPSGLLLQTSHTCHDHHLCSEAHQGLKNFQSAEKLSRLFLLEDCLAPSHSENLLQLTVPMWHFFGIIHVALVSSSLPHSGLTDMLLLLYFNNNRSNSPPRRINGHSTLLTIIFGTSFTSAARQATCPLQGGTSRVLVSGTEGSTAA